MNVTFPDDASIQIIVVPQGMTPVSAPFGQPAPLLLAEPTRKPSRRRDVVFLTVGACLCAAILAVVRTQPTSPRMIDPAHAAVSASPTALPASAAAARPDLADVAVAPPQVDPTEAVRRLLDQRPTLTPPPGARIPSAAAPGPGATPPSRNAFGMTD